MVTDMELNMAENKTLTITKTLIILSQLMLLILKLDKINNIKFRTLTGRS